MHAHNFLAKKLNLLAPEPDPELVTVPEPAPEQPTVSTPGDAVHTESPSTTAAVANQKFLMLSGSLVSYMTLEKHLLSSDHA